MKPQKNSVEFTHTGWSVEEILAGAIAARRALTTDVSKEGHSV